MAIVITLDRVLQERGMTLSELAGRIDITLANLSILKTGKARAIRFPRWMRSAGSCNARLATCSVRPVAHAGRRLSVCSSPLTY